MYKNSISKPSFTTHVPIQTPCTNCGQNGHAYRHCLAPVLSYGMLVFRFTNPEWSLASNLCNSGSTLNGTEQGGPLQILMVQRKDSLRFVEFVRGKYNSKDIDYLKQIFSNVTPEEQALILRSEFHELWQHVWGSPNPKSYRNDFEQSQIKFNELKTTPGSTGVSLLQEIIESAKPIWNEPEWGFPKGRRNRFEDDLKCAIRETEEETGLHKHQLSIFENVDPLSETFYGDNKVYYCHKYFLAMANGACEVKLNDSNPLMVREIRAIRWAPVEEAMQLIRPENVEKREILLRAISIFRNFCPFSYSRFFNSHA